LKQSASVGLYADGFIRGGLSEYPQEVLNFIFQSDCADYFPACSFFSLCRFFSYLKLEPLVINIKKLLVAD